MKISYNWLKWYVPEAPDAEKLAEVFGYHLCEVEGVTPTTPSGVPATPPQAGGEASTDWIFDLNILPNRAHDLLCHLGVARELSGQLGLAFNDPTPKYAVPASKPSKLEIDIKTDTCRRYMGRIVRNISVGPSPEWVVKHLESIGQRSINNIVDATNLSMYDCGQPMHAFDLNKLASEKITIRHAQDGEAMTTLDGKDVVTKYTDMVIADRDGILALAGVKGGMKAEVDENTTDIVLEVANFEPTTVRKTARRLSIFTDSAKRFENDLSPSAADWGMLEISALIAEMCPNAVFEDVIDVYPKKQEERKLAFSLLSINNKLGSTISIYDCKDILNNYGYTYENRDEDFVIDVPALRLDLTGEHDMAEEIGRIYGYEKITPEIPKIDFTPKTNHTYARISAAREKLLADGYSEVMTYTFTKKGKVEVARGAKGKEFLRTNLSDGLKISYEQNRLNGPLLGASEIKIFEIGNVFLSADVQEMHVAFADKKGVTESTLEEFTREMILDIRCLNDFRHRMSKAPFTPWSLYPFITRDVAVWVSADTNASELITLCTENGTALLARVPELFDQFTKGDKISLAVRLVFQSMERTLTDDEVTAVMAQITAEIIKKGWEVR